MGGEIRNRRGKHVYKYIYTCIHGYRWGLLIWFSHPFLLREGFCIKFWGVTRKSPIFPSENVSTINFLKMSYFMVDVESDGPIPGDYSMISFGAVLVSDALDQTFYGQLRPIAEKYIPEALAVSGHTREETLEFDDPLKVMTAFADWIKTQSNDRPVFMSDNNGFDWMFICWYFHHFTGSNPFGHSSQNLGSLYKGMVKDTFQNFKHLRKTRHSHHPVDDARGNAEALLALKKEHGLKIKW